MTTTADFIREMRELVEKATPGPWTARGNVLDIQEEARLFCISTEDGLPHVQDENDIAFIAAARTALPEALDRLERLEKVRVAAVVESERHRLDRTSLYPCQCILCKALREAEEG